VYKKGLFPSSGDGHNGGEISEIFSARKSSFQLLQFRTQLNRNFNFFDSQTHKFRQIEQSFTKTLILAIHFGRIKPSAGGMKDCKKIKFIAM
jgi:hypothetical protein